MSDSEQTGPFEIAVVGDLGDHGPDLHEKLLGVPQGGECTLYFDSPGGNPYCAISLMNLILLRGLDVTGIVSGECSSAAVWPFAACAKRFVTAYSMLLFHPIKWQSEENVPLPEATEWARHFAQLESQMDRLLTALLPLSTEQLGEWTRPGRYVTGPEFAEAGLARMLNPVAQEPKTKR